MVARLTCQSISKTYGAGAAAEAALSDVSLSFNAGECCVLMGPSGSGKTTLLSILGCLLTPTAGEVTISGGPVNYASKRLLTQLRRTRIGFIFQHAQLLPFLSVHENLAIVAKNAGLRTQDANDRIHVLLERLAIGKYVRRKPGDLSGGQRQRVAIARAVLHRPEIILADEPTAALDWRNSETAMAMLIEQARSDDALLIVVTHDSRLTNKFDRAIHLESGRVRGE